MFLIDQDNTLYKRALLREIKVWQKKNDNARLESTVFLPHKFVFKNREIEIARNCDWLEIINMLGYFDKGLILGGGDADIETYLLKKGTVKSVENLDIIFRNKKNKEGIQLFADLNFIELKENSYDIIIAKSILHHIINLEHLLLQVNKSLKQDGIFVVVEYIGENKQQWKDDKINFINNILKKFDLEISRGIYDNSVPFESIRSEEIPGIIDLVFNGTKIVEQKWDYIYSSTKIGLYHNQIRKNIIAQDNFTKDVENTILNFETGAKKSGLLPTTLFGLYKKSMNPIEIEVVNWGKYKIKKELELDFSNQYLKNSQKIKLIIKDYYNYLASQV